MSRQAGNYELLAAAPGSAVERVLLLSRTDTLAVPLLLPVDYVSVLFLGGGPQRGRASGVVCVPTPHARAPLHLLHFVGPGMPVIPLEQAGLSESITRLVAETDAELALRWSPPLGPWVRMCGSG